VMKASGGG